MKRPPFGSLFEVAWSVGKIADALNDPARQSRWMEARKYPKATLQLFREVQRRALRLWETDRHRLMAIYRKEQGQNVYLDPGWIRDRDYFTANYRDTSKPYALEKTLDMMLLGRHSHPFALGGGEGSQDLREWVMDTSRTMPAEEIAIYWSGCAELAYEWDCVWARTRGNKCYARDHDFQYCPIKRVGLPRLYDQLMAHYDKDYSALRAEVIESLYPADQLLALYMVQRAQDGDNVAAHRIVNAYAPVWRGVARGRYEESFCKADRGIILGDIEGYAYDTCVSALMGHRLQTVEAIKAKEGPVSVEDLTTLLNPQKLKKQWELNVEVGPRITNTAVFIYLLKRTLDDDLEITEPLYTPGGRGTSLPWDSPAKLDRLVDDCAWVLFHGMLPELATAEDPWINANRFDPVRARWNLAGFFKMVVESKLSDIYEKEYVRRVDGKRVFNVTFSLDREQEGHEGQGRRPIKYGGTSRIRP